MITNRRITVSGKRAVIVNTSRWRAESPFWFLTAEGRRYHRWRAGLKGRGGVFHCSSKKVSR